MSKGQGGVGGRVWWQGPKPQECVCRGGGSLSILVLGKLGFSEKHRLPPARGSSYQGYRSSKAWWSLWTPQNAGRQRSLSWKGDTGLHSIVILSFTGSPEDLIPYTIPFALLSKQACARDGGWGGHPVPKRKSQNPTARMRAGKIQATKENLHSMYFKSISLERFNMLYL